MKAITLSVVKLVHDLIANIFVEYTCLNVQIHRKYQDQRNEITRELHGTAFTTIISDDFSTADEQCGFVSLSTGSESLQFLANRTYNSIIRILIVTDNNERILSWMQENSALQDMDILLATVGNSSNSISDIFRKSRHHLKMEPVDIDLVKPFFEPIHSFVKYKDYRQRIVRISTFHCPVFGSIEKNELADGVETRIVLEITKKLNLAPQLTIPQDGKRWGTAYPNRTISGGLLKLLYENEADVGFCSLWIEITKFSYVAMSGHWEILCLKFLIPKPKVTAAHWSNIFKPLPAHLWTMVLATAIITSATSSSLRHFPKSILEIHRQKTKLISEFITIVGLLVMAKNPDSRHDRRPNRHLFLWWSIFAMIITSIYSSSLVSHLTYPQFEPMIDTPEEFVKAGLYWGTPYEPPLAHIFDLNNEWHRKFANRFRYEEKPKDRVRRIQQGNYSVFVKCVGDVHFMEVQDIPSRILRELRTPKSCFGSFMLGLGYRRTLPYAPQANRILRHLVESGVTKYWLDRLFEKEYRLTTFAKVYEYKIPPEDVRLRALSLLNLQGVFGLLAAGTGLACLVLAAEMCCCRKDENVVLDHGARNSNFSQLGV